MVSGHGAGAYPQDVRSGKDGRDGFTTTKTGDTGTITDQGISTAHFHNAKGNGDEASASFTANNRLTDTIFDAGAFTFQLRDSWGRLLQTRNSTASGAINFDAIAYRDTGTYNYTISEVKGNDPTLAYDTPEAKVTVKVEEGPDGRLRATTTYDGNDAPTFNNGATSSTTPTSVTQVIPSNTTEVPASAVSPAIATPGTSDATLPHAVPALLAAGGAVLGAGALRRRRKNR
jgi:pilin isopeptide linkage protein